MAGPSTTSSSVASSPIAAKSSASAAKLPATAESATAVAKSRPQHGGAQASPLDEWTAELDELGRAFRRVFRSLSRLRGRDTHLGGAEISHAQFELLIELYERGELAAGELAAAARLTPATVTQMLEHLAEQGHVERVRSDTDRRVVVSRLTPQGRRQIEAKRAAWQERWAQALGDAKPSELRAATRVLGRLGAAFEDATPSGECPSETAQD